MIKNTDHFPASEREEWISEVERRHLQPPVDLASEHRVGGRGRRRHGEVGPERLHSPRRWLLAERAGEVPHRFVWLVFFYVHSYSCVLAWEKKLCIKYVAIRIEGYCASRPQAIWPAIKLTGNLNNGISLVLSKFFWLFINQGLSR